MAKKVWTPETTPVALWYCVSCDVSNLLSMASWDFGNIVHCLSIYDVCNNVVCVAGYDVCSNVLCVSIYDVCNNVVCDRL